jgi:hypothetical protein
VFGWVTNERMGMETRGQWRKAPRDIAMMLKLNSDEGTTRYEGNHSGEYGERATSASPEQLRIFQVFIWGLYNRFHLVVDFA